MKSLANRETKSMEKDVSASSSGNILNKVPVNNIIPVSMVDGPGNRTSIFLQACNIACAYCHNPETQRMCINCGICVPKCPVQALLFSDDISVSEEKDKPYDSHESKKATVIWDPDKCIKCDTCINICPHFASPRIKWMDAAEVMVEIRKNIPFIRGITVSGGECLLYPEFLTELFTLAKEDNLTCMIDHNGTVDLSNYPALLEVTDGVMLDIKAWDSDKFYKLTDGNNDLVKKNLVTLAKVNKLEEIRIVCLPDEVDAEDIIKHIPIALDTDKIDNRLKLIRFRQNGVKGRLANTQPPTDEYMEDLRKLAKENGFTNIIVT